MDAVHDDAPSALIDAKIAELSDWRGSRLARMRELIRTADPRVTEAIKWRKPSNPAGVPVWEYRGLICTGDAFKGYVKITFARGALIPDPSNVFNASLTGNAMRALDIREHDQVDEDAFQALIRAAVDLNVARKPR